jgi:SAM-dependent methyltransferase
MAELFRLWQDEQTNPAPFYTEMAKDTVADLDRRYGPLRGQRIADLACGPGFYSAAFRDLGADCVPIDLLEEELRIAGDPPEGYVLADARGLPFADGSFDGVFCSNLLEHAPDTFLIVAELERVLRPGGWGYISWTNWYSPWGGHDMSPYHFLGPGRGPHLYERRHGLPRKNRYGEALFAVHVGPTIRLVQSRPTLEIERTEPRYWPWLSAITRVPGLRELLCWNCVIRVRKTATTEIAASTQTEGSAANRNLVVP